MDPGSRVLEPGFLIEAGLEGSSGLAGSWIILETVGHWIQPGIGSISTFELPGSQLAVTSECQGVGSLIRTRLKRILDTYSRLEHTAL